jgi:4-hydroxythreonine-4-phosphate dehydrogenase
VAVLDDPREAEAAAATALPVLPVAFAAPAVPGRPDLANAAGTVAAIARAVALVQAGAARRSARRRSRRRCSSTARASRIRAIPSSSRRWRAWGRVVMMLACELRVVPATIHIPLADVPRALTRAGLEETLRITAAALVRDFGIARPGSRWPG